jgi:uncharacterized protein (DUF736 family)
MIQIKKVLITVALLAALVGCTPDKPKPNGTFQDKPRQIAGVFGGEFVTMDEYNVKVTQSKLTGSAGYIAFDVIVNNTTKVVVDAPEFRVFSNGKNCGEGTTRTKMDGIKQGQTVRATILWDCGVTPDIWKVKVVAEDRSGTVVTWAKQFR